jgi:DNA-binding SARP family transcriptional activator
MRIQTLGSAEIIIGQTAIRPDSAVAFGLLLYLGLTAGERVPRARLVELFWPDQPETQSRHALRQLLYRLRRYGLPLAEGGEELRVDSAVVECDATPMLAAVWSATCSERDAANANQFLTDFNPEISGPFSEWLDDLRNRISRRYAEAALRHLGNARREARWADVFDWSTRCLAVDPLNQDATFALAESTAMRGAKVEAVRILDEYSRELGVLDGKIGLSTRVLRQRVSEAHDIDRSDGSSRLAMVGRDVEIARLVRIVEDVARGQGGVTWISGAAGIGKSRLATELRREAVIRGFASMMIGLQSSDRQRPFSILSDMVAQLLKMPGALGCAPETLATLRRLVAYQETPVGVEAKPREPAVQQYEIREAIADLLGALESEAPLLVFIDDYHNGDSSSVPILTDLIERTATARLLWLMTSRPSIERPPFHLRATIDLKPLAETACRQLVESTVANLDGLERQRLTDACLQIAGGNPFFAREVIRFWDRSGNEKQLPSSVARAVTDQVSRLGDVTTRVIQVIALLGSIATMRRVTRIMDCHVSELLGAFEELDSMGIVSLSDDDAVLSVHDIWRQEVLKLIRPTVRLVLHARIADVVEEEARNVREVTLFWQAAAHRGDSGERVLALQLLQACGDFLMDWGLPSEAADTMRRALTYCSSNSQRLDCQRARIRALHSAGHWTLIQNEIQDAIALIEADESVNTTHHDLELIEIESLWRERFDFRESLKRASACGRDLAASLEHRVSALLLSASIADNLCEDIALRDSVDSLTRITNGDSRFVRARSVMGIIFHTSIGELGAAIEHSRELIASERLLGSVSSLSRALRYSTYPLRISGDFEQAAVNAVEALRISEEYCLGTDAGICCDILATISLRSESLTDASHWVNRADSWARRLEAGHSLFSVKVLRAQLAVASGDAESALSEIGDDTTIHRGLPVVNEALSCLAVAADAFRLLHDTTRLTIALTGIEELLPKSIRRGRVDGIMVSFCRGLLELGERAKAADVLWRYVNDMRRDRGENQRLKLLAEALI